MQMDDVRLPILADNVSEGFVVSAKERPFGMPGDVIYRIENETFGLERVFHRLELGGVVQIVLLQIRLHDDLLAVHQADDIVTPTFEITPSEDLKYIEVTVTGYPANYINYRKATQEDVNLIVPFLDDNKNLNTNGVLIIKRQ